MSVIISGDNGISDVDGSAGTPAIRGTDANTGIFFPAADTIAFAEGGAEAMRIDSSGNVGIGTSSPTTRLHVNAASGYANLRVGSAALASRNSDNDVYLYCNSTTAETYLINGEASLIYQDNGNIQFYNAPSGTAGNPITFTERARIDSSGNLQIGVTGGTGRINSDNTGTAWNTQLRNTQSSGNGYAGVLANFANYAPNDATSAFFQASDTSAVRFIVRSNGGIANYQSNDGNLSDRREKTNFAPAKNYLDTICSIPVQTFNYIDQSENDPGLTLGVVAQDVQEVAPELVMESDWGTEEEPKMRLSIYQTDLQYALMKSIQELKAINDAQASRIETLEAKVAALEAK